MSCLTFRQRISTIQQHLNAHSSFEHSCGAFLLSEYAVVLVDFCEFLNQAHTAVIPNKLVHSPLHCDEELVSCTKCLPLSLTSENAKTGSHCKVEQKLLSATFSVLSYHSVALTSPANSHVFILQYSLHSGFRRSLEQNIFCFDDRWNTSGSSF